MGRFLDRDLLMPLVKALDTSDKALSDDEFYTGTDYAIRGKAGHIYPDGTGFLIVITEESARRWKHIKRLLPFCRITQDGDYEGCLHLDHLPSTKEADAIREAVKLHRKRRPSPAQLAALRPRAKAPSATKERANRD